MEDVVDLTADDQALWDQSFGMPVKVGLRIDQSGQLKCALNGTLRYPEIEVYLRV